MEPVSDELQRVLLRVLFERTDDVVAVLERAGPGPLRVVVTNAAAGRVAGPGGVAPRLVRPDELPRRAGSSLRTRFEVATRSGEPVEELVAREFPTGTRWFRSRLVPLPTEGERRRAVLIARDVTEEQENAIALAETERLAGIGHWAMDLTTGEVTWSTEIRRLLGDMEAPRDLDGALGLIHPEDEARVRERLRRALATGDGYRIEYRVVGADGEERVIESRVDLTTDEEGRVVRVSGTAQDLTHRRAYEEARRRAEEARRRQEEAMELNDTVIQGLALAKLSLRAGRLDDVAAAIDGTLAAARSLVARSLEEAGGDELQPGDLRRRSAARILPPDAP